ncbi:MAG TPA: acetyltransferase [Gammaproteobacteria bacterium]|nr:acetyltransferase [Gammaproteobacteria bacterium]
MNGKDPAPGRDDRHWAELGERGTVLGFRILSTLHALLGPWISRLVLVPVVAYFFITHPQARRASRRYLERVQPYSQRAGSGGPRPSRFNVWRHFWRFAVANLDMFAAWRAPAKVRLEFRERERFSAALQGGRGLLLLSAHLGNLELTRALATQLLGLKINALVYTQHAVKSNQVLEEINEAYTLRLIQVSQIGTDTALLLRDKIESGEVVVIVGDRTPVSAQSQVTHADFLGKPAPFAVGPYVLAHVLECPVYLFFCVEEDGVYSVHLEPFAERIHLPRRERREALQALASRYAARLADYAARYPLQWYNFYDFWAERPGTPGD